MILKRKIIIKILIPIFLPMKEIQHFNLLIIIYMTRPADMINGTSSLESNWNLVAKMISLSQ